MPLVLTDAPGTHHAHLLTRTISSSPAVCVPRLIAGAHVVRCCLVHRLMTKCTHVHRASCACMLCCRRVRRSVRPSVCHKSVLGPVSKLLDVRSRSPARECRFLVPKNLNEIQTRSLLTGTPNAGGLQEIVYTFCVIICVSQKRHKFGFLLPSRTNRFPSFLVV